MKMHTTIAYKHMFGRLFRTGVLMLILGMSLSACGRSATSMHLRKTEGTVSVSDGDGRDVKPREDLGLYSGYQVGTQTESFAWIDLDSVKLTKLNENSEAEIVKDGKKLTIDVLSGELYFNVTKPLKEDETLEIRTSSMVTGIRGTRGWVTQDTVCLLEGTVTVTAGDQTVTVNAGEMAVMSETGELTVKTYAKNDVPDFVSAEPGDAGNPGNDGSGQASGSELSPDLYEAVVSKTEGEVFYSGLFDLDRNGTEEIVVLSRTDTGEAHRYSNDLAILNKDTLSRLTGIKLGDYIRTQFEISLTECDDMDYLCVTLKNPTGKRITYYYLGPLVNNTDGSMRFGRADTADTVYEEEGVLKKATIYGHDERGVVSRDISYEGTDMAEVDALTGKYTKIRDLVVFRGATARTMDQNGNDPGADDPLAPYEADLYELRKDYEHIYTEFVDFEGDGDPELFVLGQRFEEGYGRNGSGTTGTSSRIGIRVYRDGFFGTEELGAPSAVMHYEGEWTFVRSGEKLYLRHYDVSGKVTTAYYYGVIFDKELDRYRWTCVDHCVRIINNDGYPNEVMIKGHDESGAISSGQDDFLYHGEDLSRFDEAQEKYTHERDILTYVDQQITFADGTVIVPD